MFVAFYIVNLYICVCMTCSTSYCLYDTLIYQWNKYVCVCFGKKECTCLQRENPTAIPPPPKPTICPFMR